MFDPGIWWIERRRLFEFGYRRLRLPHPGLGPAHLRACKRQVGVETDSLPREVEATCKIISIAEIGRCRIRIGADIGMPKLGADPGAVRIDPHGFVIKPARLVDVACVPKLLRAMIVIGTNGAGTLPHYAGLLLQRKGGLPVTLVPYHQGGTPAAVADIMGGRLHATIEATFGLGGPLKSGDLQLIAMMSAERDPDRPSAPTVDETMPGLTADGFMSLAAPAKTPEAIVRRLNESLNQALETPAVKQRFAELGIPISVLSPAQASAFVDQQRQIWLPLVSELEGR